MKATLDLPEDIYKAARSLADRKKISLGAAVTELARHGRALLIEAELSNRSATTSGFQQHEMSQALAGDTTDLARLIGVLVPIIRARVARSLLLRSQGGNTGRDVRQEIENLTQEVFLTLFANGGRVLRMWQHERGATLEAFVGLVTERQVSSILRSGKRRWRKAELDRIADDQEPEARAASREQLRLPLDRLTEKLSSLGRRLFKLLFLKELPIEAVARQTIFSPEAVGIQIASLNDQIWELIVAHGNDPGLPALVAPLREQVRALQREEAEVVRHNFQAQLQFDAEAGMRFIEETERLWEGR